MEATETKPGPSTEPSNSIPATEKAETLVRAPSSTELDADDQESDPGSLSRVPRSRARVVKSEVADAPPKSVANAPFVNKVWNMVNDPRNQRYIRWMPGGKSIEVVDREGFEKDLLPFYFKHKRFTSFVRQLNMYGWHKVQDINAGTMQSAEEHWQFASPFFVQNKPELLSKIVRNKGAKIHPNPVPEEEQSDERAKDLKSILKELEQIKSRQAHIGEDLGRIRHDNEMLWDEYYTTRERYDKHNQMLSRILRFLATVYGTQSKILDFSNDNNERLIRPDSRRQSYQLLPQPPKHLTQQPAFDNEIMQLKEIERLQDQIQKQGSITPLNSGRVAKGRPPSRVSSVNSLHSVHTVSSAATSPSNAQGSPMMNGLMPDMAQTPTPVSNPTSTATTSVNGNIPGMNNSLTGPIPPFLQTRAVTPLRDFLPRRELTPSARISEMRSPAQSAIDARDVPTVSVPSPALEPAAESVQSAMNMPAPAPISNPLPSAAIPPSLSSSMSSSVPSTASNPSIPVMPSMDQPANLTLSDMMAQPPQQQLQPQQPFNELIKLRQQQQPVLDDDPSKLFPELGDMSMPSLSNQELEQISKDIASNGMSLQSIQDWLTRLPENAAPSRPEDDSFNVDEFLTEDNPTDKDAESVDEPDRKRVRVV